MKVEPLPDFARRLVEDERAAQLPAPSLETLDRVLARVEHSVGLGGAAVRAGTSAAVKLALVGAGLLAGIGGTLAVQQLVSVPFAVPAISITVPPPPPVVVPPTPEPVVVRPKASQAPSTPDPLEAEQRLVDTARAALVQQRPDAALEAVAQHRARYPRGQLSEERDAVEVQALWKAGRDADARTKGAAFRRRYPQSIFNAALDALERPP